VAKVVKGLANSKGVFTPVPKWSGVFIIQAARASDIPTVDLSDALSDALSDTADPGNILRRLSDNTYTLPGRRMDILSAARFVLVRLLPSRSSPGKT